MSKIDISLGGANSLLLSALAELFEQDDRFSLMSSTSSAEAFLQNALTVPSVVGVIDWSLPTLGAERLVKIMREQESPMRIIVCTHSEAKDLPKRAMACGAAGFFSHSEPPEQLLETAVEVAAGKMIFPYLDVRDLHDPLQALTKTERTLIGALSQGRTNVQLAEDLNISINTVKFHLRNLYEKLQVNNRAQAIAYYYSSINPIAEDPPE
ncbi:MAG: response regulator transcription factor [Pseudomonadota bacterium]